LIKQGIGDIAGSEPRTIVVQPRELRGAHGAPRAWPQIDAQVGGVARKIVGIDAATVPNGHEYPVAARRGLPDAIDRHLTSRRIPGIGRVAAV
jgi:hypothetical protein